VVSVAAKAARTRGSVFGLAPQQHTQRRERAGVSDVVAKPMGRATGAEIKSSQKVALDILLKSLQTIETQFLAPKPCAAVTAGSSSSSCSSFLGPYLMGQSWLSIADLSCACELNMLDLLEFDYRTKYPNIANWIERVQKETQESWDVVNELLNNAAANYKKERAASNLGPLDWSPTPTNLAAPPAKPAETK
jgi:glutathione S-transferase